MVVDPRMFLRVGKFHNSQNLIDYAVSSLGLLGKLGLFKTKL